MLSPFALTTIDMAKAFMGLDPIDTSQDDLIEFLINSTTDAIQKECSRIFNAGSYEYKKKFPLQDVEYIGGYGLYGGYRGRMPQRIRKIDLEQYPLLTAIVTVNGNVFTDFTVDNESGSLINEHFWDGEIDVLYTAGYVLPKDEVLPTVAKPIGVIRTLPFDLEETCCQLLSITYNMRGSEHNEQEDVGPMRNKYVTHIPTWIKQKLEHYYRPVIV